VQRAGDGRRLTDGHQRLAPAQRHRPENADAARAAPPVLRLRGHIAAQSFCAVAARTRLLGTPRRAARTGPSSQAVDRPSPHILRLRPRRVQPVVLEARAPSAWLQAKTGSPLRRGLRSGFRVRTCGRRPRVVPSPELPPRRPPEESARPRHPRPASAAHAAGARSGSARDRGPPARRGGPGSAARGPSRAGRALGGEPAGDRSPATSAATARPPFFFPEVAVGPPPGRLVESATSGRLPMVEVTTGAAAQRPREAER
jgi:hypothetical protein